MIRDEPMNGMEKESKNVKKKMQKKRRKKELIHRVDTCTRRESIDE